MPQDALKLAVAQAALELVIPQLQRGDILGVGTGSTANCFIAGLGAHKQRFAAAVASSEQSAAGLRAQGIEVVDLNSAGRLRFYVDGADESNPKLQLIKGGGAALTREKIVAACSEQFICIADRSKWVAQLGRFPLPVEVIPMARGHVARELEKLGGRPVYRQGVVTDNGCDILDVHDLAIADALALETAINQIVGVVSNGLFAQRPADVLLLADGDGVKTLRAGPH